MMESKVRAFQPSTDTSVWIEHRHIFPFFDFFFSVFCNQLYSLSVLHPSIPQNVLYFENDSSDYLFLSLSTFFVCVRHITASYLLLLTVCTVCPDCVHFFVCVHFDALFPSDNRSFGDSRAQAFNTPLSSSSPIHTADGWVVMEGK